MVSNLKTIGIIGGMGPYAGLDLIKKIFDQTLAGTDQEHVSVVLLSIPQAIEDRTAFLLGKTNINPAHAIGNIIQKCEDMGASVVGIPCHSVHTPTIFDVIIEELKKRNSNVNLLHMINEVLDYIKDNHPNVLKVGVLCTAGTFKAGIYPYLFEKKGYRVVPLNEEAQEAIHQAIYEIKAQSNLVNETIKQVFFDAMQYLKNEGAQAIILGCTEIPLVVTEKSIGGVVIIDSTLILARALIKMVNPHKLKPL